MAVPETLPRPAVTAELPQIKAQLPALRFPVASAADLTAQVTQGNRTYQFRNQQVDPKAMIARIPASDFPIASQADFDAKVSKLMAPAPAVAPELPQIKAQLPALRFPVANAADLIAQVAQGNRTYQFRSQQVDPKTMIARIPASVFPITSQADFDAKISNLILTHATAPAKG